MQSVSDTKVNLGVVKVANQFYSGKNRCTEGEFHLLLYSTRAAMPTLPIDVSQGTNIASSHKTMSLLQFR